MPLVVTCKTCEKHMEVTPEIFHLQKEQIDEIECYDCHKKKLEDRIKSCQIIEFDNIVRLANGSTV
jgi:hypothetical protein